MTETITYKIKELDPDIIPPITSRMSDPEYGGSKIVVIGKPGCFAAGTKIMMYNGTLKNVEDVQIGDIVMGDDSSPRNVLDLCHNFDTMYKIIPNKGDSFIVNENHILSLKCTGYNNHQKEEIIDICLKDYLKKSETFKNRYKWYRTPVNFSEQETEIDPYIFGYWLGDGTTANTQITTNDQEVVEYFQNKLDTYGLQNTKLSAKLRYNIKECNGPKHFGNKFLNFLRDNNVLNNKHIPLHYKVNSREKRLQLLAGILDSDGSYDSKNNVFDFIQKSETLFDDIIFLARSLGFSAYKCKTIKKCTNSPGHQDSYYRCSISGDLHTIPTVIERKQPRDRLQYKDVLVTGFQLEKLDYGEYFGFTLDGNHRFLLNDFSVTHNTGKSTLIASLLYSKKHIFPVAVAMSGSEDSNSFYRKILPSTFVFNEYDEEKLKSFIKRQKIAKQHLENPWAVIILDDCTDDPRIFNTPLQQGMYKRGRHWKMWYILSLQYAMDVKPVIRTNVDGIFILREPILKNRKSLWENYASIVPDFSLFCELMDQLTDDHTAMYIHNTGNSNDWKECVFWYKAPLTSPDFKFGCDEYKQFHYERYNPEYIDPFDA
jgi:hypothetical protein